MIAVKEQPIIMSGAMVRALLDGSKTQTRRPLRKQPLDILPMNVPNEWIGLMSRNPNKGVVFKCKYGQVGQRLWVRETFYINEQLWVDDHFEPDGRTVYKADKDNPDIFKGAWKPSIHMPRWASRIDLEITEVRLAELNDMTEEDAKAEGIYSNSIYGDTGFHWVSKDSGYETAIIAFERLWDSLYAQRGYGWETNCFVWVLTFKVV